MATYQADKIQPNDPSSRFFGMFVSRSSAGKDTAAMTFPKPILVLDFDLRKGQFSDRAKRIYEKMGTSLKDVTVKTFPPLTTTWADVEKEMSQLWMMFSTGQRPYNTIVIASITTCVRVFMTDSIEDRSAAGKFTMSAPVDYKFEGQVALQMFDYLRSFPCNIIVDAHLVNVWGKDPKAVDRQGNPLEYQQDIITGEEISIRHKLGENMLIYFDEVYKFSKNQDGSRFMVEFQSNIARSMFDFKAGTHDITDKPFYQYWQEQINKKAAAMVK